MNHKFNVLRGTHTLLLADGGCAQIAHITNTACLPVVCRWAVTNGKLILSGGIISAMSYDFHATINKDFEHYLHSLISGDADERN